MIMKKLMLLLAMLGFTMCFPKSEWVFLRSYVMNYHDGDNILLRSDNNYIIIFLNESQFVSYASTGEEKERYDALCEKHNDMTFDREVQIVSSAGAFVFSTNCIGVDFVSIDIVSNASYDAEHPAYGPLGDIVTSVVRICSPAELTGCTNSWTTRWVIFSPGTTSFSARFGI